MAGRKFRGSKPQANTDTFATRESKQADGYPHLSLSKSQPGYGVEELTERQRSEFLLKWSKRSKCTWQELLSHPKHGLGFEQLPQHKLKRSAPEHLQAEKYMVFRHDGNLPLVGYKIGDVFYLLWAEARYGDVYDH